MEVRRRMTTYANVTEEEMAEILEQLKSNAPGKIKLPERLAQKLPLKCRYAIDSGERAFVKLPCRGNKIFCQKIEGHVSYTSACNPGNCKHFEQLNQKGEKCKQL